MTSAYETASKNYLAAVASTLPYPWTSKSDFRPLGEHTQEKISAADLSDKTEELMDE